MSEFPLKEGKNLYISSHVSNADYDNTSSEYAWYRKQESEKICTVCGFASVRY